MELEDECDAFDPEILIQCPYNKHHKIRARRFPYHLVKCQKSHPEVAQQLATCPFSARHLVPQADLRDHIMKCSERRLMEHDIVCQSSGFQREQMNAASTWQAPPCDEDWEAAGFSWYRDLFQRACELLEQSNSLFIWGRTNSDTPSSSSEQKNFLPPGLRVPLSFPPAAAGSNWQHCAGGSSTTASGGGHGSRDLPQSRASHTLLWGQEE
ncbi:gametocyte-specific factor 1-like isoform X2 [Colius striatus]|uniref:gametocyte-specific factor 1 isoform X2 n=1 Tax=Colius striatus TaxID=57412 RepID=UPI002B1E0E0C|nr:gametocyte-specific factor 1 isoform X2 [Colius striatus]XP_061875392.1 gametocyte-specific factor 1-like isoform X2 [Colius striatus]